MITRGNQAWTWEPPEKLQYSETCLWYEPVDEVPDFWHGYQYLDKFDLVCYRLGVHELTAIELEQGADYKLCERDLPTMRLVPLDTSVMWLRRNETTERVLDLWREGSDDWGLALLRAIYLARPLLYLLPADCFEEVSQPHGRYTLWATKDRDDWTAAVFEGDQLLWRGGSNEYPSPSQAIAAGQAWIEASSL